MYIWPLDVKHDIKITRISKSATFILLSVGLTNRLPLVTNQTYIWPFVRKADIYTANNHLLRDFFNLTRCDI